MRSVKVAYALEGHRDLQVIPVLVQRLAADFDPTLHLVTSPVRARKHGFGFIKELPEILRRASAESVDVLVCVVDGNSKPSERIKDLREGVEGAGPLPVRVVSGVAVRAMEAWLLADEGAISAALAGRPAVPKQAEPRSPRDPKAVLQKLIAEATAGDEFLTDAIGAAIAAQMDLRLARDRCPDLDDFARVLTSAFRD